MSEPISQALEALGLPAGAADYAKSGFHAEWQTQTEHLVAVGEVFRKRDYILETITAQDRRAELQVFRLIYVFNTFGSADRHVVRADIAPETPAPTLTGVFPAADWMEREIWDMYGVPFADHPNLKRLLLPEDADFFPLRKDFGVVEDD